MQRNRFFLCQYTYEKRCVAALIFLAVWIFSVFPCLARQASETKRVLLIPSYNFDYLGIQWFNQGIMSGFAEQEGIKISYSIENLQLAAYPNDETYFETMAAALRIKYAREKPDLIIAQYKPSTQFLYRYGQSIFADVPVVFAGLELEDYGGMNFPPHFTGITTSFNAKRNIDLILQLHPQTKTIYVIAGVGSSEKDMVANVMKEGEKRRDRLEFVALNQLPMERVLEKIEGIHGNAAILYLSMQIDANGKILVPAEVAKEIGRIARVPVYGMLDTYVGSGITGGFLINHYQLGRRASNIGGDVLRGRILQANPPVNEAIGEYTFDWRQLQRWAVSEDKLPSGSKVDFKQFRIWEQYKWELVGGLCLIILQGLLVFALLVNRANRKRADMVLRESEERYRAALEQSSDAIAIVDIKTRRILEVNRQWSKLLGYSESEAAKLTAYDVLSNTRDNIDASYASLLQNGHLPHQIVEFRRKDGSIIEMERVGTVIKFSGKQVFMFANRDVSTEKKLQALLGKDVSLAADVQRSFVPSGFVDTFVTVKTIYVPYHMVSGDFFDYTWNQEHKRFSGFILDISGHGIASSLQGIAVSTYFRDVLESQMNLPAKLQWINQHVLRYFTEDTYAAALCFEFDFSRQTLNFATAGVYGFLSHSAALPTFVKKAGSLIGISTSPEYTEWSVPICTGEAFYFMSDGILDQIEKAAVLSVEDYDQTVEMLRRIAENEDRKDDCCAICVRVNGKPSFPIRFDFYRPGEYRRIRSRIRDLLYRVAGEYAGHINVAAGEALNNAARASMDVQVKLNVLGNKIVIRVKDGGQGFDGNARVAEYAARHSNIFEERLYAEDGRGIMIMVSWMDRVLYNRQGNEVMLIKELRRQQHSQ